RLAPAVESGGSGRGRDEWRDMAPLPAPGPGPGDLRRRVARPVHRVDDARPGRPSLRAPPRAVGRVRTGPLDRAALRDARRPRGGPPCSRGAPRAARLPGG